jgi:hypothetical protein
VWAPDAAIAKKILVDNPARLTGSEAAAPTSAAPLCERVASKSCSQSPACASPRTETGESPRSKPLRPGARSSNPLTTSSGPVIRQQPPNRPICARRRPHGIADAAAEREFGQRRRRRRPARPITGRLDAGAIEFGDPLQDRVLSKQNCVTTSTRVPVRCPQSRHAFSPFSASGSSRKGCPSG